MKLIIQSVLIYSIINLSSAVIIKPERNAKIIPGSYIVTLKDGVNLKIFLSRQTLHLNNGRESPLESRVKFVYGSAINGFAAELDEQELKYLDSLNEVLRISYDQVLSIFSTVTQPNAEWGLSRISRGPPVNPSGGNNYLYNDLSTGRVTVFVVDSGINADHNEFLTNGVRRASLGPSFVPGVPTSIDDRGHGTHKAGIIAGNIYGVAKNSFVVGIKIVNSSGSSENSQFLAAIDYVCSQANSSTKFVVNLSLGGEFDQTINDAVKNATSRGIVVAVAAGNGGNTSSSCDISPASEPTALTVGATDINDTIAWFSSRGHCIDLLAPGQEIKAAYYTNNTATAIGTGTSCSAPFVAGLAAYLWGLPKYVNSDSSTIVSEIKRLTNDNRVNGLYPCLPIIGCLIGTPNKLARNDINNL